MKFGKAVPEVPKSKEEQKALAEQRMAKRLRETAELEKKLEKPSDDFWQMEERDLTKVPEIYKEQASAILAAGNQKAESLKEENSNAKISKSKKRKSKKNKKVRGEVDNGAKKGSLGT
jgi:hypothetical protein